MSKKHKKHGTRDYTEVIRATARRGMYVLPDHPRYTFYNRQSGKVLAECTNGDWNEALQRAVKRKSEQSAKKILNLSAGWD